jgi:hypothetical protein
MLIVKEPSAWKDNFEICRRISLYNLSTWSKFVSPFEDKSVEEVSDEIFQQDVGRRGGVHTYEVTSCWRHIKIIHVVIKFSQHT